MNTKLSFEEKYKIIGSQDSKYEGAFITAVKTTGIFCRPSCRARKPNIENVEFYSTTNQAIQNGFRPCKICKPLQELNVTPVAIIDLLNELNNEPEKKISDSDLVARRLKPHQIRRWFKKQYGLTFQEYQRQIKISQALKQVNDGKSIIQTAFESGYQSLSGFNSTFKTIIGSSASYAKNKNVLNYCLINTPLGTMVACASEEGLSLLEFNDTDSINSKLQKIVLQHKAILLPGMNEHLVETKNQINEYFLGQRQVFKIKLNQFGTDFRQKVWAELINIQYGTTISYKQQAEKLKAPNAFRAIASANGKNYISIIVPCHRVIGSDGNLKGYSGGVQRKKWLIEFEKPNNISEKTSCTTEM